MDGSVVDGEHCAKVSKRGITSGSNRLNFHDRSSEAVSDQ